MYIYIYKNTYHFSEFSRRTWSPGSPGGKTASLLIVFATSVSESSLEHFSLQKTE